jgi:hypothetical protein
MLDVKKLVDALFEQIDPKARAEVSPAKLEQLKTFLPTIYANDPRVFAQAFLALDDELQNFVRYICAQLSIEADRLRKMTELLNPHDIPVRLRAAEVMSLDARTSRRRPKRSRQAKQSDDIIDAEFSEN